MAPSGKGKLFIFFIVLWNVPYPIAYGHIALFPVCRRLKIFRLHSANQKFSEAILAHLRIVHKDSLRQEILANYMSPELSSHSHSDEN